MAPHIPHPESCTVTVAEHPRVTYMHDRRWGVGLDVRVPEGPVMIRTVPVQWLLEGHHGGMCLSTLLNWDVGPGNIPAARSSCGINRNCGKQKATLGPNARLADGVLMSPRNKGVVPKKRKFESDSHGTQESTEGQMQSSDLLNGHSVL